MQLTAEKKKKLFTQYGASETNTGSAESQIALFTHRINHLTEHLRDNKKDYSTQLALLKLVGKRRRLLYYFFFFFFFFLKDNNLDKYREIIKSLNIRK